MKKKDKIKIIAAAFLTGSILVAFLFFGKDSLAGKAIVVLSFLGWLLVLFFTNKYIKE
ncbi:MAG: hypothetical protein QY303_07265 [Vicingaceae bacterium]|nr:hypothetical protein [Flavobacteriales bacterium]WKZ73950.1 MAG: hypothetical protein QY303_07265 [Vicingaceae bacterium]